MESTVKRLRVVVDLSRCEVYGQCVFAAPSAFRLRGEDTLPFDPMPDTPRAQLLRAARACPVQAITVGEVDLAGGDLGRAL